jgi:hypothetical protein
METAPKPRVRVKAGRRPYLTIATDAENVVVLHADTRLDIPAERVLSAAFDAGLTDVVVLGYDGDGDEYFASSVADGGDVLWLLERGKTKLLRQAD